ncbi:MAG: kinase protein [Candidatus Levybacteria bacterium]|nr:kinase protein [Candidatus Levybacteria bacterium]
MKSIRVSAPGKLHLLGEHAVVYGKPAIIAAVNKRCFVIIIPRKNPPAGGKKIEIISDSLKVSKIITEKEILAKTKDAQTKWETYIKTNDISLLKSITSDSLDFPFIIIGETLKFLKKSLSDGITLSINSDIPIGSGMGSSAALSVSIAGAIYLLFNKNLDKEVINEIAYSAEQKKHGFPSGGDNAASCFGGMIWYRKESPDLKIIKPIPFSFPQNLAKNFSVIHTGTPVESTGEMVGAVRALYQEKPELVERILSEQEKLTRELLDAIKKGDDTLMIRIIRAGEGNLEILGVVSDLSKTIIREIEKAGGAAKICGGGGKTKGTGIVLAYHKSPSVLDDISLRFKLQNDKIKLGEEGLRQEKYE